jgi:hypothetical protein
MNQADRRTNTTISDIIHFYRQQLDRFNKIGIGKKTEYNTTITDTLIEATKRRLLELQQKKWKILGGHNETR